MTTQRGAPQRELKRRGGAPWGAPQAQGAQRGGARWEGPQRRGLRRGGLRREVNRREGPRWLALQREATLSGVTLSVVLRSHRGVMSPPSPLSLSVRGA